MPYYESSEELQAELVAFLTRFTGSRDGAPAIEAARALGDRARLVLRTRAPETVVSVDFFSATVSLGPLPDADVEVTVEADALHDVLLDRLDPVQISRLYETERLTFAGSSGHLAALILLAGPLQPHYRASLIERGRQDLVDTPLPPTKVEWGMDDEPPKQLINRRRVWQRPKKAAATS